MQNSNDSQNPGSKSALNSVEKPSSNDGSYLNHDSNIPFSEHMDKDREGHVSDVESRIESKDLSAIVQEEDDTIKDSKKHDNDVDKNIVKDDTVPLESKDNEIQKMAVESDLEIAANDEKGTVQESTEEQTIKEKQHLPSADTGGGDGNSTQEEEWMDILGSGQLKKKVLRKGENSCRPQNLQLVEVNLEGQLADGTVVEKVNNFKFQLGDNEVVQGLDLAVPLMDVGEEALVEVGPRFAYSSVGRSPDIPPDATISYKVELLSAEPEPYVDTLSVDERSTIGNKKRERGNWWYERQNFTAAIQCYRRAVDYLDEDVGGIQNETKPKVTDDDVHKLLEDRLKVFNNLAAAQMKIKSYDSALESVEKVLACQPKNVKALFRKGKILAAKGDNTAAISVLRIASQLEPESKTIKQELLRLLTKNKRETKIEQNLYKRMLGQNKSTEEIPRRTSKFHQIGWGVVFGSVAAMVAGIVAYRYKFL